MTAAYEEILPETCKASSEMPCDSDHYLHGACVNEAPLFLVTTMRSIVLVLLVLLGFFVVYALIIVVVAVGFDFFNKSKRR